MTSVNSLNCRNYFQFNLRHKGFEFRSRYVISFSIIRRRVGQSFTNFYSPDKTILFECRSLKNSEEVDN